MGTGNSRDNGQSTRTGRSVRGGLRWMVVTAVGAVVVAASIAVAAPATAAPATAAPAMAAPSAAALPALQGTTQVTTAPGIATTLLGAGIVPLPVRSTSFRLGFAGGINVTYGFPIVAGNPDLSGPRGDILHTGGINFVSFRGTLEIGKFDIDLEAGKVFATEVNYAPKRLPVLDLDLSRLVVSSRGGATVLSGIGLKLDPVAASALDATFGIHLPTDGSLTFGTGTVTVRG